MSDDSQYKFNNDNQYKFNEDILNILSQHPDDAFEVGARGWVCPNSNLQHSSWAIFVSKPWKGDNADEIKTAYKVLRTYVESQTTVYSLMNDKMQEWSKQGLTEYRDAINEVLALWDDLDKQEKEHSDDTANRDD